MSTFQDRVRELKGFLGKLLPRTASKTRRSAPETSEEVGAASQPQCCPFKSVLIIFGGLEPHRARIGDRGGVTYLCKERAE